MLEVPTDRSQALRVERHFTRPEVDPLSGVAWSRRAVVIQDAAGGEVFRQDDVEVPATWSDTAARVVSSKYFRGASGSPQRETSVRQLLRRVVGTVAGWAEEDGTFASHA